MPSCAERGPATGSRSIWSASSWRDPLSVATAASRLTRHRVARERRHGIAECAAIQPAWLVDSLPRPRAPVGHQHMPVAQNHLGAGRAINHLAAERAVGIMELIGDTDATAHGIGALRAWVVGGGVGCQGFQPHTVRAVFPSERIGLKGKLADTNRHAEIALRGADFERCFELDSELYSLRHDSELPADPRESCRLFPAGRTQTMPTFGSKRW